ncbi:uncharacterized protein LOC133930258 [Phragmites australis]|uniref:uncharacterized protein LOC133930258 n=1 Tax=Phragmites australis TaxID=29695 RepID=UPI002D78D259|nr:uncharacterized protein LOC133930258 [Phragmites australis]
MVFCEATNIRALWDKHKDPMSEDYMRDNSNTIAVEQMVLRDIRDIVHSMGKDIRNYVLPEVKDTDYLLRIGNGTERMIGDDYVRLPDDIVIGYTDTEDSINKLIQDVFPSLEENARSIAYMIICAILSTKNEHVGQLNAKMIDKFPGQEKVYHSFDSVDDDSHNHYPIEFLNSITPNGLPPHVLKVRINCPMILLRNLDPNNGLCNGIRLIVRAFQDNAIDVEIVGGQHVGKRVFIPRITLFPSDDISLPFKFNRKQIPICLNFAMTINKS